MWCSQPCYDGVWVCVYVCYVCVCMVVGVFPLCWFVSVAVQSVLCFIFNLGFWEKKREVPFISFSPLLPWYLALAWHPCSSANGPGNHTQAAGAAARIMCCTENQFVPHAISKGFQLAQIVCCSYFHLAEGDVRWRERLTLEETWRAVHPKCRRAGSPSKPERSPDVHPECGEAAPWGHRASGQSQSTATVKPWKNAPHFFSFPERVFGNLHSALVTCLLSTFSKHLH